ncbi:hypothetical protein PROFUN_09024 [Planoprotostelium fungivorum]|uniref:DUF3592 domain-containing protein n=1 Tax=Planoprotostelium fungivorum TaxID=1890364 RepID=A0A2P6MUZ4_9EUKA|nr:hypothetical protein PROFUN_09024 [Planoprotostelium fungivorum]
MLQRFAHNNRILQRSLLQQPNHTRTQVLTGFKRPLLIRSNSSQSEGSKEKGESKEEAKQSSDETKEEIPVQNQVLKYESSTLGKFGYASVILAALGGIGWTVYSYKKGVSSQDWEKRVATVENSNYFQWSSFRYGVSGLSYTYDVDGQSYRGTRMAVGSPFIKFEPVPFSIMLDTSALAPGRKIYVYVNPLNPKESTIEKGTDRGNCMTAIVFFGVLVFLGLTGI